MARLQHAVARPLQGEGQLEQLLPELGGDRVGLVADQRREHLLSRAGRRRRARRAQPRRRRRRAHWIWSPPGKRTRGALGFDAREDWASEGGNGRPRVESRRSEGFKRRKGSVETSGGRRRRGGRVRAQRLAGARWVWGGFDRIRKWPD